MHYLAAYLVSYSIVQLHSKKIPTASTRTSLYDGAQVWKTDIETSEDISAIMNLINNQDLSLWHLSPDEAIYLVQPERKLKVHRLLSARGLNHTVVIMDVQRRIDAQQITEPSWDSSALRRGHRMDWEKYPTLEVIHEYLNYMANQYPSLCKLKAIGRSEGNRTIQMMIVSNGNPGNNGILVVAGQHAREWIAITSALLILREIATKFDDHPDFLQNKDWYIIPVANPDGYHYSYTHDRFWRKNRRRFPKCFGVDINRNYGKYFDIAGIMEKNECLETFSGLHPFSELETIALNEVILKLKDRLRAMVDLHSFSQLILYPWGALAEKSPDSWLHNKTTSGIVKDIMAFQKKQYKFGPAYHTVYPVTGSLMDWAYSQGIRHSYAIEGRDKGFYGFLIPPDHIQEAGEEMLIVVKHLARVIEKEIEHRHQVSRYHKALRD